jgi:RNA polymerase sigma factor (sigma-70 family)
MHKTVFFYGFCCYFFRVVHSAAVHPYSERKAFGLAGPQSEAIEIAGWIDAVLAGGDTRPWGRVYERFKKPVFSLCFRMLGNTEDARDTTSEAFIRALENLDQYDRNRPFFPWLSRIVRNLCIDRIRRDGRIRFVQLDDWDGIGGGGNADDGGDDGLAGEIREAIDRLKPPQKLCFSLFYLHDKPYDEIVRVTGYTYDQVRSYIQNGRRKLRLELGP